MHIRFTNHAQFRVNERKIRLVDVEKTLKEGSSKNSFSDTYTARRVCGGKTLEVVYKKKGKETIVITAYYL